MAHESGLLTRGVSARLTGAASDASVLTIGSAQRLRYELRSQV